MESGSPVHVIDDDESVRDSLCFLLTSYDFVVQSYTCANDFLSRLSETKAGCIITDVRMPGMDGLQLIQSVYDAGLRLPVIVVTGHGDVPLAVRAMKLGAREFLEKPFEEETVIAAVRSALAEPAGVYPSGEADRIRSLTGTLSERERQTLAGLVSGSSNKAIGLQLGISPRTVEVYRASLMNKMGAKSLSELVKMALIAER